MSLRIEEQKFSDLSQLDFRMFLAQSEKLAHQDILILRFIGEYREGSSGNPDAIFMDAMATASLLAWCPSAVIVDLSELHYVWGDMLEGVFPSEEGLFDGLPAAMIVGPDCREAIRTLIFGIEGTEHLSSISWIHDTMDSALDYVEHVLQNRMVS